METKENKFYQVVTDICIAEEEVSYFDSLEPQEEDSVEISQELYDYLSKDQTSIQRYSSDEEQYILLSLPKNTILQKIEQGEYDEMDNVQRFVIKGTNIQVVLLDDVVDQTTLVEVS